MALFTHGTLMCAQSRYHLNTKHQPSAIREDIEPVFARFTGLLERSRGRLVP